MSDLTALTPAPQDENQLILERREKLRALREVQANGGGVAFPNSFKPTHKAAQLHTEHCEATHEALDAAPVSVSVPKPCLVRPLLWPDAEENAVLTPMLAPLVSNTTPLAPN